MSQLLKKIAQVAYSYEATVLNSYELANLCVYKGLEGDLVECGVGAGAQLGAMLHGLEEAYAHLEIPCAKTVYGFDSFQGIPLAGPYDQEQPGIGAICTDVNLPLEQRLVSSGVTVHSQESVLSRIYHEWALCNPENAHAPKLMLVPGWFQNTLPEAQFINKICLLRLDGDLYESTLCCLALLYPRVVEGGFVIIDDYALEGCKKAVHDYFESIEQTMPALVNVDGHGVHYFKKESYV
jgi:hypothetical protein